MHVYGTSFVPWCSPLTGERSHFCNKSLRSPLKACVHPSHTLEHVPLHMPLELCIHAGGQKKKKKKDTLLFLAAVYVIEDAYFSSAPLRDDSLTWFRTLLKDTESTEWSCSRLPGKKINTSPRRADPVNWQMGVGLNRRQQPATFISLCHAESG